MSNFGFAIVAVTAVYILSGEAADQKSVRNNSNICHGHPDDTAFPNNESCTKFYTCIDGNPQPNTCPKGQWFNTVDSFCDSSENKDCKPDDESICPKDGIYFIPHEKDCDKYYMCFAGFPILSFCAEGLYFDREALKCDRPEVAECKMEKCPTDDEPNKISFLPSDVDCEKYYICYNGDPLEQYCAPGIHWNPKTDQCDFVENVNCTIKKPDEPEIPEPHEIPCDHGIYFETHPNSCEHYFICSFGISILLNCAPGFNFDSENNWCDLPEYAKCEAKDKKFVGYASYFANQKIFSALQ